MMLSHRYPLLTIAILLNLLILYIFVTGDTVERGSRVDCAPKPGISQEKCTQLGCIWDVVQPNPSNVPFCYFPADTGYTLDGKPAEDGTLQLRRLETGARNPYGEDIAKLVVKPRPMGSGLAVEITTVEGSRYIPPVPLNTSAIIESSDALEFKYQQNADPTFYFTVERKSDGCRLWDTSIGGLLFSDQYIQHDFTKYTTWGFFARDDAPKAADAHGLNYYGTQPFYLAMEPSGKAHGVLILNSNAQDITTGPAPHLVYRTTGGQLNLYFFPGPTPEQVVQQYAQLVGKPFLPPYWALGYQFCRYGYKSLDHMAETIGRIRGAGIPIDVAYADIDYMDRYKDFTYSKEKWASFPTYTNQLHKWGMHLILIFDPAIQVNYAPFQRALEAGASFIEWPTHAMVPQEIQDLYPLVKNTKIMLGVVWPDNHTAFPDFLDPTGKTAQWWAEEVSNFHQQIPFDGMWIDMNEPSNFGTNEANPWYFANPDHPNVQPLRCPSRSDPNYSAIEFPAYETASSYLRGGQPLHALTLCLCGMTARGNDHLYNTHNLYGWSETVASQAALTQRLGKRAPVISRSTFPSSGHYGGHWLGDNYATWTDLRAAIIGVQEFNLFAIPYVGSDVCGFNGPSNEELCLRWQQLGAFHSFFRNHNTNDMPDQDPARWPSVALATKEANLFRYSLLPYLYSLHFHVSLYGGTVVRPVFFEFPADSTTHTLSHQFMWGRSIMVVPVIYPNVTEVRGYLPPSSQWYSISGAYKYGQRVVGGYSTFSAPRDTPLPTFVRGGSIIPKQEAGLTTTETRSHSFRLLVALEFGGSSGIGTANGELYWDDGEALLVDGADSSYYHFTFSAMVQSENTSIVVQCDKVAQKPHKLPVLDTIEILGHAHKPDFDSVKVLRDGKSHSRPELLKKRSFYAEAKQSLKLHALPLLDLAATAGGRRWTIAWKNL